MESLGIPSPVEELAQAGYLEHPWVLLLGMLPVALAVRDTWKNRGRECVRASLFAWVAPSALFLAVVILAAGPRTVTHTQGERAPTNVQFCIDVSGSMTMRFGLDQNRYEGALDGAQRFMDERRWDAFGLSFFGNSFLQWVPVTPHQSAITCAAQFMRPEKLPARFGGTEIRKALLGCRSALARAAKGKRVIVLMSDGFAADLRGALSQDVARVLRDQDISLYMVHMATSDVPQDFLEIARSMNGEAFHAPTPEQLDLTFNRIGDLLGSEREARRSEVAPDDARWRAIVAVLIGSIVFVPLLRFSLQGVGR